MTPRWGVVVALDGTVRKIGQPVIHVTYSDVCTGVGHHHTLTAAARDYDTALGEHTRTRDVLTGQVRVAIAAGMSEVQAAKTAGPDVCLHGHQERVIRDSERRQRRRPWPSQHGGCCSSQLPAGG